MDDVRIRKYIDFINIVILTTLSSGFSYDEGIIIFKTIVDMLELIDKNPYADDAQLTKEVVLNFEKYLKAKNL